MIALALLLVIAALVARAVWKEFAELDRVEQQLREYSEAQDRFLKAREEQLRQEIQTLTTTSPNDGSSFWINAETGEITYVPAQRLTRRPAELDDPDRLAMIREGGRA